MIRLDWAERAFYDRDISISWNNRYFVVEFAELARFRVAAPMPTDTDISKRSLSNATPVADHLPDGRYGEVNTLQAPGGIYQRSRPPTNGVLDAFIRSSHRCRFLPDFADLCQSADETFCHEVTINLTVCYGLTSTVTNLTDISTTSA